MGSMSRRNSRQVSVRLSAAFVTPPSMPGSRSVSRAPGDEDRRFGGTTNGSVVGDREDIEVLREGDVIGSGCILQGQVVRSVHSMQSSHLNATNDYFGGKRYEVMRKLGTGSYAVVYLVREILQHPSSSYSPARPPPPVISEDVFDEEDVFGLVQTPQHPPTSSSLALALGPRSASHRSSRNARRRSSLLGPSPVSSPSTARSYGSSFAIKVLSKANLDAEQLAVQMTEVTIHQSLPGHSNIVTLHSTLETDSYLLLVLEYVPGEDLYYFLEQQREEAANSGSEEDEDGYSSCSSSRRSSVFGESDLDLDEEEEDAFGEPIRGRRTHRHHHHQHQHRKQQQGSGASAGTPPTPSLLSSVHPAHMLSYGRLKLIASMFGQMCDAVQACHARGISHRDIKPENFIVTTSTAASIPSAKAGVIVKLSDFGLATTEKFSADVDCGSAPYMSYECRNVVGPTYATQPADVWSLGIVLINMLYHHNLWHDTILGDASFEAFRAAPIAFLMQRSPGMTHDVAEFLADRVFRILPEAPDEDAPAEVLAKYEADLSKIRVTAGEFGEWARHLPSLFFAGNGANPLLSTATETASEAVISRRSSFIEPIVESPDHVYGQLQVQVDDDEDEEGMFAEKTFTQADARHSLDEDEGDITQVEDSPILPDLLVRSSPSSSSSVPMTPISPRTQTPLPAEPMPLAQPIVDLNDNSDSTAVNSGAECVACSLDAHLGLGLGMITKKHSHDGNCTRSASAKNRRKRGARKGKAAQAAAIAGVGSVPPSAVSSPRPAVMNSLPAHFGADHLEDLALDTQYFAREVSRTRKVPERSTSRSRSRAASVAAVQHIPPPVPSLPLDAVPPVDTRIPHFDHTSPSLPPTVVASQITKKPSKWFNWSSRDSVEEQTERATSLLKGLDSTLHSPPSSIRAGKSQTSSSSSQQSNYSAYSPPSHTSSSISTASSNIAFTPPPLTANIGSSSASDSSWRGRQPASTARWSGSSPSPAPTVRSGLNDRWVDRSPASSVYSSRSTATTVPTWRNQGSAPASAASSMYNGSAPSSSASSAFTRFRNGSEMSFSTTATTVSASSAFNAGGVGGVLGKDKPQAPSRAASIKSVPPPPAKSAQRPRNVNVKVMPGIPWELDELPRQMHPNVNGKMPQGHIHGVPPPRRNKHSSPVPPQLATITERPKGSKLRGRPSSPGGESGESDGVGSPVEQPQQQKKVQKAQVNALAKLLTSFKTKRD